MRRAKACMVGAVALSLAGCKGCKNDHPYVPYSIASDAGETESAEVLDAGDDAAEAAVEISATTAPAHASSWTLSGLALVAPPAMVFELGVVRDFDGDGKPDAVAIARNKTEENDFGTLLYYHGENGGLAAPLTVAVPPALGPKGVACTPKRTMSAVGRHSLWLELAAQCPSTLRDPMRQISVWSFRAPQPREHLSALVIDPPGAPKLTFLVDASDADGDGLDDVRLRVRAEGGDAPFEPLPRAEASVRWFDRPAGMSRDPDGPDGSLRYFASMLAVRAAKVKDAPTVLAQARAVHVLWSALCGGADARITHFFGGGPLACGSSRALEEAGLAEARADAVLGDPLAAVAALDRAQLPPATKTASRTKDAENWITQVAPIVQASQVRAIAAVPLASRGTTPAWGALAFEPSGKLLVRTVAGVVRVDPDQGDENDASDVPAWPTSVTSPDGTQRFVEAYDACDGISLHATLMKTDAGDVTDVRLPIAPRLGARCTSAKGVPVATVPLAWTVGGLETIVEGQKLLVLGDRASLLKAAIAPLSPHGSARSPDARTFAFATSLGILVQGETKSRLVRATDLDGTYAEQRGCTVSNDATHVACVRAGKAWVATLAP
ncbi:MAG TPA: hypothetical protein VGH28_28635 [Polyangiaceae bacterium]